MINPLDKSNGVFFMKNAYVFIVGLGIGVLTACAKDYSVSTDYSNLAGVWQFEGEKDVYVEHLPDGSYYQHQVFEDGAKVYFHQSYGTYKITDDNLVSYIPNFDSCLGGKSTGFSVRVKSITESEMTVSLDRGFDVSYKKLNSDQETLYKNGLAGKVKGITPEVKCFQADLFDAVNKPILTKPVGSADQVEAEDAQADSESNQATPAEIARELTKGEN